MPERRDSLALRTEAAVAAVLIAVAVVGLTLLPLTTPLYVRTLVRAVHAEELTGLGTQATLDAAESVRRFVLDADAPPLAEEIGGRPAFDEEASSHLVDVRNVLLPARSLALAAAALAAAWLIVRRGRARLLNRALGGAAWLLVIFIGVAALVGLTDFDAFFTWFHTLFFAAGTWTFPADALLIQVFPLPFWMASAATWAVLVLATSGLLFSCARGSCFTRTTDGV